MLEKLRVSSGERICRQLICPCTSEEKQNVTTESLSLAFAALLRVCERRWNTCQRKVHFVFTVHGFSFPFFSSAAVSHRRWTFPEQSLCQWWSASAPVFILISMFCRFEFSSKRNPGGAAFHLTSGSLFVLDAFYYKRQVNCSEMLLYSKKQKKHAILHQE